MKTTNEEKQKYTYKEFIDCYNALEDVCKFAVIRVLNNLPLADSFDPEQLRRAYKYIRNYITNTKKISLNQFYARIGSQLCVSSDAIRKTMERNIDNKEYMDKMITYLGIDRRELCMYAFDVPKQAIVSPVDLFHTLSDKDKWLIKELVEDLTNIQEKIEAELNNE